MNTEIFKHIESICRPLRLLGVTYFQFTEMYHDGSMHMLCNHLDWYRYYFENKLYDKSGYTTHFPPGPVRFIFCRDSSCCSEVCQVASRQFNISPGVTLIEDLPDSQQFFLFCSSQDSPDHIKNFSSNFHLFKHFILYFRDKAKAFLTPENRKKRFQKRKAVIQHKEENKCDFIQQTQCERYYLNHNKTVHLTQREFDCLNAWLSGKSTTEIAKIFSVSCRTVESHITNLKLKLNCSKQIEIIHKVAEMGLLNPL